MPDRKLQGGNGASPPGRSQVRLRLYIRAVSPISARAVVNLRRFLDAHLAGQHSLEILDLATHATRARDDQIIASPTLLILDNIPPRRLIGDLSDADQLRAALLHGPLK
ncbi:circadian clock KaiB family protein [Variovorax sp. RHLX14]|uniref:circadian clock KaiB family protein n=1 Tax=Variovorax sp. RHLX14 TaxID=1259731 RepID=UPI003F46F750